MPESCLRKKKKKGNKNKVPEKTGEKLIKRNYSIKYDLNFSF